MSQTRRQPVPARGDQTLAAVAAAEQTPPAAAPASEQTPPAPAEPAAEPAAASAPAHPLDAHQGDGADRGDDATSDATEARALIGFDGYDVDDLVTCSEAEIRALFVAGRVDPHPDAVAYAKQLRG